MLRLLLLGTVLGSAVIPVVRAQSLSQVGDQAAKDVAENRKKAAAELDKGVRGQTDAKGVRGTGPEQGSPADIVVKMGVDPNSEQGKAYMTVLEAQRASLGNAAFDTRCMPKMVNNDSGMAQGEVFIQQYMAALSAGNAQGISDAVRRGQDNTAAMNHATASAKGPNCANTTTSNTGERRSKGAKIIDVSSGSSSRKGDALTRADAERRFAKVERLRDLMIRNPSPETREALMAALNEAADYYRGSGLGEEAYKTRFAQYSASSRELATAEAERRFREIDALRITVLRDPTPEARAALEAALDDMASYYNQIELGPEAYEKRFAQYGAESKKLATAEADRRFREIDALRNAVLRDPTPEARAALETALDDMASYYNQIELGPDEYEKRFAQYGVESKKLANAEADRRFREIDALRNAMLRDPTPEARAALETALDDMASYYNQIELGPEAYQKRFAQYGAESEKLANAEADRRFRELDSLRNAVLRDPTPEARAALETALDDIASYYNQVELGPEAYQKRFAQYGDESEKLANAEADRRFREIDSLRNAMIRDPNPEARTALETALDDMASYYNQVELGPEAYKKRFAQYGAESEKLVTAEAERRFGEVERLRDATIRDPSPEKRAALETALDDMESYYNQVELGSEAYQKRLEQYEKSAPSPDDTVPKPDLSDAVSQAPPKPSKDD